MHKYSMKNGYYLTDIQYLMLECPKTITGVIYFYT
jgi:hypothetical protein